MHTMQWVCHTHYILHDPYHPVACFSLLNRDLVMYPWYDMSPSSSHLVWPISILPVASSFPLCRTLFPNSYDPCHYDSIGQQVPYSLRHRPRCFCLFPIHRKSLCLKWYFGWFAIAPQWQLPMGARAGGGHAPARLLLRCGAITPRWSSIANVMWRNVHLFVNVLITNRNYRPAANTCVTARYACPVLRTSFPPLSPPKCFTRPSGLCAYPYICIPIRIIHKALPKCVWI